MMKKLIIRILSIILILAIFIGLIPPTKSQAVIVPDIETEVYYISSASDLTTMNLELYDKFVLKEDIEIDGNWNPISNFKGTFDGSGHTITYNLSETTGPIPTSNPQLGLFASCTDATIKNLYVKGNVELTTGGSYFNPSIYVGGIIGNSTNSTLENVHFSGNINIITSNDNSSWVGGLIGQATTTNILLSSNEATITTNITSAIGSTWVGGLCGEFNGRMERCYNAGNVTATAAGESSYSGGLIGHNKGIIVQSYNSGGVLSQGPNFNLGKIYAGGIAAKSEDDSLVINCAVMSPEINVKLGWVNSGYKYIISSGGSKSNNISINNITGSPVDDSNLRYTESELKTRTPYSAFDFYSTWGMNGGYPIFELNSYAIGLNDMILPDEFLTFLSNGYAELEDFKQTDDGFTLCTKPLNELLRKIGIEDGAVNGEGDECLTDKNLDDWYVFCVNNKYGILKMRPYTGSKAVDPDDSDEIIGTSIPFMTFDMNVLKELQEDLVDGKVDTKIELALYRELNKLIYGQVDDNYSYCKEMTDYFGNRESKGSHFIADEYIKIVISVDADENGYIEIPYGLSLEQWNALREHPDILDEDNFRIKVNKNNLCNAEKKMIMACRTGNATINNYAEENIMHARLTDSFGRFLQSGDETYTMDEET